MQLKSMLPFHASLRALESLLNNVPGSQLKCVIENNIKTER